MRKILMTVPVLVMLLFGAFLVTSNSDTENSVKKNYDPGKKEHSCCSSGSEEETISLIPDNSIYNLESAWTDQDGNKIKLTELQGKPVVLTMFFASCTYACPILVNDMKKIESKLSAAEKKDYRFVLVSIDHERDTPAILNEYADMHKLDLSKWKLLTGDKDDILELAAVLGFKYKKDADGQYSHSNLINILDKEGSIVYQHKGLNNDVTAATVKLNEQLRF